MMCLTHDFQITSTFYADISKLYLPEQRKSDHHLYRMLTMQ